MRTHNESESSRASSQSLVEGNEAASNEFGEGQILRDICLGDTEIVGDPPGGFIGRGYDDEPQYFGADVLAARGL